MLDVGVGQHVLVVAVQHPPQHLPVDLVLAVELGVVLVQAEQLDHVETCLALVERVGEHLQPLVVVLGGEGGQISVEYFYDELGNVGGLPLLFLWLFDEQGQYSVEGLDELARVEEEASGAQGIALGHTTKCNTLWDNRIVVGDTGFIIIINK